MPLGLGLEATPATAAAANDAGVGASKKKKKKKRCHLVERVEVSVTSSDQSLTLETRESYSLSVAAPAAMIQANSVYGALRGMETLAQLARRRTLRDDNEGEAGEWEAGEDLLLSESDVPAEAVWPGGWQEWRVGGRRALGGQGVLCMLCIPSRELTIRAGTGMRGAGQVQGLLQDVREGPPATLLPPAWRLEGPAGTRLLQGCLLLGPHHSDSRLSWCRLGCWLGAVTLTAAVQLRASTVNGTKLNGCLSDLTGTSWAPVPALYMHMPLQATAQMTTRCLPHRPSLIPPALLPSLPSHACPHVS